MLASGAYSGSLVPAGVSQVMLRPAEHLDPYSVAGKEPSQACQDVIMEPVYFF